MKHYDTIEGFANLLSSLTLSDRYCFVVTDGEMGEGKSCFSDKLSVAYSKAGHVKYDRMKHMIYVRKELKQYIDGDGQGRGRLPERSVIHTDELISLFFNRNWYDAGQIASIELLNKCRDRHLLIVGNIPNFWALDAAVLPIITFWVHIHERGEAWVFQKSRNPWATDKWYKKFNEKLFDKKAEPHRMKGFVAVIKYDDWTAAEKREYYRVRNLKRMNTEAQSERMERYGVIKEQRDELLKLLFHFNKDKELGLTQRGIAELLNVDESLISYVLNKNVPAAVEVENVK